MSIVDPLVAVVVAVLSVMAPAPTADLEPAVPVVPRTVPPPPPTTTTTTTTTTVAPRPQWTPGDCDSVEEVFAWYGATQSERDFFFGRSGGRNVIWGETGCGLNTNNPNTSDTGICQINSVHERAGYFWGTYYPHGWLSLFGLRTEVDADSPGWVPACLFLYRNSGSSPWKATR